MDPTNNLLSSTAKPGFSVAPCPGAYSSKSAAGIGSAQSSRRDVINSIGKVGDISVLNSVGGGAIGEGLRTLTHASNAIRTGCGSLPTIIGSSLDQGANWVLDSMGINSNVIDMLKPLNPGVANQALGSAQQIYQRIKQGHFKATDIPSYLQEFQNLERLARGIYTPGNDRLNSLTPRCAASPYALDLLARAPKYKFLFVVQFKLDPGFSEYSEQLNGMAFVIKKSSRPHIKFVTEDVNYYNFRTKVITKTDYEEMSMTFHDDNLNNTFSFYDMCIKALSPIANNPNWIGPDMLENSGMNFPSGQNKTNYAASLGPLNGDSKQHIFQEITLYHVYDWGHTANVYHFYNPHITQLQPDDVDMSESSCNELTMAFHYDYAFIETVPVSTLNLEEKQAGAVYPLRFNDSAKSTQGPNSSGLAPFGNPIQTPSSCNTTGLQNTSVNPGASGPFNGGFGAGF